MYSGASRMAAELGGPLERLWGLITRGGGATMLRCAYQVPPSPLSGPPFPPYQVPSSPPPSLSRSSASPHCLAHGGLQKTACLAPLSGL